MGGLQLPEGMSGFIVSSQSAGVQGFQPDGSTKEVSFSNEYANSGLNAIVRIAGHYAGLSDDQMDQGLTAQKNANHLMALNNTLQSVGMQSHGESDLKMPIGGVQQKGGPDGPGHT